MGDRPGHRLPRWSIPARTGEPRMMQFPARTDALSPRVRGNPAVRQRVLLQRRSIPARTGEPETGQVIGSRMLGLSPRVRGNPLHGGRSPTPCWNGLSPRVRGNQCDVFYGIEDGNTVYPRAYGGTRESGNPRPGHQHRVYPRAYGGTKEP